MAKVRVYELAKELGMESKELLSILNDMGEFVRSASSTIEAPVVRRVSERVKSSAKPAESKPAAAKPASGSAKPTPKPSAPMPSASAAPQTSTTPRDAAPAAKDADKPAPRPTPCLLYTSPSPRDS